MKTRIKAGIISGAFGLFLAICLFGPKRNREELLAKMGNTESMNWLGNEFVKYRSDYVEHNFQKGIWWLERAAARGDDRAIYHLFQCWSVSAPEHARFWLSKGVEAGDAASAEEIMHAYEFGMYGYPKNQDKRQIYDKIWRLLKIETNERLGQPRLLPRTSWEWSRWVKKAAAEGDPDALYFMYLETYYPDPIQGRKWLARAVDAGSWIAAYHMAICYWRPEFGSPKEREKGLEAYEKGRALEEAARRRPVDWPAVLEGLRKRALEETERRLAPEKQRALRGDASAMESLASSYEARGEEHWKAAVEWYMKAGDAGNTKASMRLVHAYQDGALGLPRDAVQCDVWFRKWQAGMGAEAAREAK